MDLLKQLENLMLQINADYAICGGYAIDLFVGEKTRSHKDLDISAFWKDRDTIIAYMLESGWQVYEPCGLKCLHRIFDVKKQKKIKTNIWCVKNENTHYQFKKHRNNMYAVSYDNKEQTELDFVEVLFNTSDGNYMLYAKNKEIQLQLKDAILYRDSIPYLAPELVLLYKSNMTNNIDYQRDFEIAIQKMSIAQLNWLLSALNSTYPQGHMWINAIKTKINFLT